MIPADKGDTDQTNRCLKRRIRYKIINNNCITGVTWKKNSGSIVRKIAKIFGLSFLVVVFIGTLVFLYKKSQAKPDVFEIQKAQVTNIVKKTVATGSVIPRKEFEIKPQVSGIVEEIFIQAGQKIRKGDVIARVKIIPDMVNLNNAESRVNRAKLNMEDARI